MGAAFLTAAEPAGELIADERVRHLDQPELTHPPRGAPVEIRVVRLIRQSKHGVGQQMFPHRRRPGEDVVLRDVSADVAHLATIHQSPVDAHATVRHLSLRRATGQVIQQRRLARAARTENRKQTRSGDSSPIRLRLARARAPVGETRHPAEDTPDHPGRTRGRLMRVAYTHTFSQLSTRASRRRRVAYDDVVRRPGPASARSSTLDGVRTCRERGRSGERGGAFAASSNACAAGFPAYSDRDSARCVSTPAAATNAPATQNIDTQVMRCAGPERRRSEIHGTRVRERG